MVPGPGINNAVEAVEKAFTVVSCFFLLPCPCARRHIRYAAALIPEKSLLVLIELCFKELACMLMSESERQREVNFEVLFLFHRIE